MKAMSCSNLCPKVYKASGFCAADRFTEAEFHVSTGRWAIPLFVSPWADSAVQQRRLPNVWKVALRGQHQHNAYKTSAPKGTQLNYTQLYSIHDWCLTDCLCLNPSDTESLRQCEDVGPVEWWNPQPSLSGKEIFFLSILKTAWWFQIHHPWRWFSSRPSFLMG